MSKAKVKIGRLNLNFKGVSPQNSKYLANGLGNEILNQFVKNREIQKNKSGRNIKNIDAGRLRIGRNETISDLRRSIATKISSEVISKSE